MPLTEEEIDQLEAQIPELSRQAVAEAYARAVASGQPVTVAIGEELIEISANEERRVVGQVPPATQSQFYTVIIQTEG